MFVEVLEDIEGELFEEGEVVGGVHDQHLPFYRGEPLHVSCRADDTEDLTKVFLCKSRLFNSLTDVASALTGPDYVSEPRGCVIEGADLESRIVGCGYEGVAGPEACAEDAKLLVALFLEPVDAGADVDYGLLAGCDGAPDVC